MAPKIKKAPIPRPVNPGKAPSGPTNADLLRKILANRKGESVVKGTRYELPQTDVLHSMAVGTDENRAVLREMWNSLDERQQNELRIRIARDMPSARYPKGVDEAGKPQLSIDAKRIMDIVEGGGLDPKDRAAINSVAKNTVGFEGSTEKGGTHWVSDGEGGGRTEQSFSQSPDAKSTSVDREGALSMEAPADEAVKPKLPQRPAIAEGFDPKASKVHDPHSSKGVPVEQRPHFRVGYTFEMDESGNIIREVDPDSASMTPKDTATIARGRAYEESLQKRDEMRAELMIAQAGSLQNAAALLRRAQDGDEEAKAIMSGINTILNKEHPIPQKPWGVEDYEAAGGEMSPQQQVDDVGKKIIFGGPGAAIYRPMRGGRDYAMDAWLHLQTKSGKDRSISPNQLFSSPRHMAEQYVRNMSPEVFEMNPLTPNQRLDATDTLRQFDAQSEESARAHLGAFHSDMNLGAGGRQGLQQQAIDRMEQIFRDRFGDQWGEGAQTTSPASVWSEGDDAVTRQTLGKGDPRLSPSPNSSEPAGLASTSTDPGSLPQEGGRPNVTGDYKPKSFEERLAEYQAQSDRLLSKTRNDKAYREYEASDEYVATPNKPTKPNDGTTLAESPDPMVEGFDIEDYPENPVEAFKSWKASQESRGWKVEDNGDGTFTARDPRPPRPEYTGEEPGRTWNELDAGEQHQRLYGTYDENGKPTGSTFEDVYSDFNRRYPMVQQSDLDSRSQRVDQLSEYFPDIKGAGRTSEILKQIDEIENSINNQPEAVAKLEAELQAEGLTPARAKEIRDQLKPMYAEHEASIAPMEEKLAALKSELRKAHSADQLTGIQSRRKSPLSGKVKGPKDKAPVKTDTNPADTQPVTPPTEVKAESDAPVIEGRPDPAPKSAMDVMTPEEKAEAARLLAESEDSAAAAAPAPVTQADAPSQLGMDDAIDPLDSAHPTPMDQADAVDSIGTGRDGYDNPEAEAAAKVDEAEAPRDAESVRPDQESATTPDSQNPDNDPKSVAKRQKQEADKAAKQGKFPTKTAIGIGAAAVGAGLFSLNSVGHRVNQNAARGAAPGADPLGPGGMGPGGMGPGDAVPTSDGYGVGISSADRIREMQRLRGMMPNGRSLIAQDWN